MMARLTLFDKNKTCCVDFMKKECKELEGHCCYCSTNEKVWDKLLKYEETYEVGKSSGTCKLMKRLLEIDDINKLSNESIEQIRMIICGEHSGVCSEKYSGIKK